MSDIGKKKMPKSVKLQVKFLKKSGNKEVAKSLKDSTKDKLKRGMSGKKS